jgi:hypothetical protein
LNERRRGRKRKRKKNILGHLLVLELLELGQVGGRRLRQVGVGVEEDGEGVG